LSWNFNASRSWRKNQSRWNIAAVRLNIGFSPIFVCYEKIVLEIKAVSSLTDEHRAQVLNYLSATGHQLGLLVNFGHHPKVEYERILARPKPVAG